MPSTLEMIGEIVRTELGVPDAVVDRETTAEDVDGWDSLAHTRLLLAVERSFSVRLPGEKMFDLASVGELTDLVDSLRNDASGNANG